MLFIQTESSHGTIHGDRSGVVILSFASKSDDANSSITEPALQALGAANLQT